jgi:2-polyprenyl-6-methoxyphenol hydroxylase-like FAD-dependent oxidoreductase
VAEEFDVIVVGARCAGSPLAAALACRGLRVCLLDRSGFPSEVPSTHMIHPSGVARLARLGVLDKMLATGAPPLDRGTFFVDDVRIEADPAIMKRFGAPWLCVRRITLDSLLVQAAEEAGAQLRRQTPVIGLVKEDGVVRGVETETGTLSAALVVGADGPHSAIARFVGAREYHVTAPGRLFLWAYFEGAAEPHGRARLGRVGDLGFLAMPTDDGLFMAGVALPMGMRDVHVADVEGSLAKGIARIEELADVLRTGTRVGPIRVMSRWHGYFREATGPGWVLVGDAGHFKDPTPAQGISDALRQGERLATAIESGLGDGNLANHLAAWWRWRDDDAWEMYWFAADMGAGLNRRLVTELIRDLSRQPEGAEKFLRILNHDVAPSTVFGPGRGLRTLARMAATHPGALPRLVSEARSLVADDARRRRRQHQPEFSIRPDQSDTQKPIADALTD